MSTLSIPSLAALIALCAIAVAGPTWQQELPPFDQDKAPLMIVLELARSMDATDVAPSRIERARQKVLDLSAVRKGARTGLLVFAASAHLVVPPTEDPALLALYVPALSPELMPHDGRNAAAGLALAKRVLHEADDAAGTIVFLSDGFDESHTDAFVRMAKESRHPLLWLAVGTERGGAIYLDGRDIVFGCVALAGVALVIWFYPRMRALVERGWRRWSAWSKVRAEGEFAAWRKLRKAENAGRMSRIVPALYRWMDANPRYPRPAQLCNIGESEQSDLKRLADSAIVQYRCGGCAE